MVSAWPRFGRNGKLELIVSVGGSSTFVVSLNVVSVERWGRVKAELVTRN